ncbi:unnamed protein product [Heterobilharzia americana]|nr:unnamed protein product [Heterobilharzia americana]
MVVKRAVCFLRGLLYESYGFWFLSPVLLLVEIICGYFIISNVPYTEIDWVAYMQQVAGFLNGTLDYDKLEGQTGPCVLFNDPVAMFFMFASVTALLYNRFTIGSILFSLGVSIKMNVLLFFPGFLTVLVWHKGILETIGHLCECFTVQLVVGTPFLFHNAWAYVSRAFDFSRQFLFLWTVNWKFLPEDTFLDRRFHLVLLIIHLCLLFIFFWKFVRSRGGLLNYLCVFDPERNPKLDSTAIIYPLFLSNFVGIVVSRSLHYQFYVWYFHTIPYLLWCVKRFSTPVRLLILGLIEICWNTYPSTSWSSGLLHACHLLLLIGLITESVPIRTISLHMKKDTKNVVNTPTKNHLNSTRKKASKASRPLVENKSRLKMLLLRS